MEPLTENNVFVLCALWNLKEREGASRIACLAFKGTKLTESGSKVFFEKPLNTRFVCDMTMRTSDQKKQLMDVDCTFNPQPLPSLKGAEKTDHVLLCFIDSTHRTDCELTIDFEGKGKATSLCCFQIGQEDGKVSVYKA